MLLRFVLIVSVILALSWNVSGQTPTEEQQLQQLQQVGGSSGDGTTILDRLMTVVEPLRSFDLREAVTGLIKRVTSFFNPTRTVTDASGREIGNPELDQFIRRMVDVAFDYAESYMAN